MTSPTKPTPRLRTVAALATALLSASLVARVGAAGPGLTPGPAIDYAPLAFQPQTWKAKAHSTLMLPWAGTNLVFLTTPGDYDGKLMARWVQQLDAGWTLYADLTGARPAAFKQLAGKATIAAVPDFDYTCGAGCGYLGQTGVELAMFYRWNYPALQRNADAMPHYVFYEMGRNFYTFGDRHSCFTTGFAVFMRYVCMDALRCVDDDAPTRRTIEQAEAAVKQDHLPFMKTFTNADGWNEKQPRLKDAAGKWIEPSDQPVTYASAMLRLHREQGGNEWLRRFFRALRECPTAPPDTRAGALQQCWHWYLAASLAARKDLSPVFVDDWRLPLAPETRQALAELDWQQPGLTPAALSARVKPVWQ
jgi:hypothetical protein